MATSASRQLLNAAWNSRNAAMMAAMPKPIHAPELDFVLSGVGDHLGVVLKREAHGRKLLLQVCYDCSALRPSRSKATTSMCRETASQ